MSAFAAFFMGVVVGILAERWVAAISYRRKRERSRSHTYRSSI